MEARTNFFRAFVIILFSAVFFMVAKEFLPKKLFSENKKELKNVVIDSLLLEVLKESESEKITENSTENKAPEADTFYSKKIVFEPVDGLSFPSETFGEYAGYQYLIPLFEKWYQLEQGSQGNVRIAYFGDSMTDGDMIVQDFRNALQSRFGGKGVGFVPITSESAASRSSVKHQYSDNWTTISYLSVKKPKYPFGVNGHVFVAKDSVNQTWVSYKAGAWESISKLNQPTLFYGASNNHKGEILIKSGTDTIRKKLHPEKLLNTLSLTAESVKNLRLEFIHADSIPVYGVNFDDGKGVHVDNFSNRGNSGLPISIFNKNIMREFQNRLGYDLIILHYGTNVLNYGSYNYDWYEKSMKRVVSHIKECFPGVCVLVISTADKSTKYNQEMKTDSAVVPLTKAQRNYALGSQSAFFDLYSKMGGENSMVKWVEEEPEMAAKDYTHFNYKGAKKVASMLNDFLMEGYNQYKKIRPQKVVKQNETLSDTIINPEP